MNDFCDLLGTPDAPVSKITSVKGLQMPLIAIKIAFNLFYHQIKAKTT